MQAVTEEIGLLLVHGMGEQKPLEHLRTSAREFASFLAQDPKLIALDVADESATEGRITLSAVFRRAGVEERTRLHLHEVFWADLGIGGGLLEQVAFWLWGLGQWGAQTVVKGNPSRNTEKLMANPRFRGRSGRAKGLASRLMLIGAALLAILTFFTWSAAKRFVALFSKSLPEPSLIFMFLGDVKIYERPGGPGKGSLLDPNTPMRATIRRRMVRAMLKVALQPYDRWYVFAHSLGTVPAFNAVQEAELTLPNYLTRQEWEELPAEFRTSRPFTPPGENPSTDFMMPRRPPWLNATDGISRSRLFERFAGLVTFGSPLDKFAALWPRVVPLNRQAAIFPRDCEWVNLHDPTDPVAARLDAFRKPRNSEDTGVPGRRVLQPRNFACRSSRLFGLSHIRYFSPRPRGDRVMPAQIVAALFSRRRTKLSVAAAQAVLPARLAWLRSALATVQVILLGLALTSAAAALLLVIGKALPDRAVAIVKAVVGAAAPRALAMLEAGGLRALLAAAGIALLLALLAILIAGLARFAADSRAGRWVALILALAVAALAYATWDRRPKPVATGPLLRAEKAAGFRDSDAPARQVAFSPDGRWLATSSASGLVVLRSLPGLKAVRRLRHPGGAAALAFAPAGATLATAGYDGAVRLWDLATGRPVATLARAKGTVWTLDFSPDGRALAAAGEDRIVRLWDPAGGRLLRELPGHQRNIWEVRFSPDGDRLASGGFDATARLWNAATGAPLAVRTDHAQAVVGLAWSRDGRWLATGGDDSTVRIRRGADGVALRTIPVGNHAYKLAFSPDSRWLAAAGRARGAFLTLWHGVTGGGGAGEPLHLWRVGDGTLVQRLNAPEDMMSLAFSPDGRWLATAAEDGEVALWKLRVGTGPAGG